MPLTFYTQPQQMIFVDPLADNSVAPPLPPNHEVNAFALKPNHTYNVFVILANSDAVEYPGVHVNVVHSPFGINLPGGPSLIIEPAPVDVPPAFSAATPGLATVEFQFTTPPGGHGCLSATILPSGPSLQQNVTVCGVPFGMASNLSFLVYGGAAPITLTLTERDHTTGAAVPAAASWHPMFLAPAGTGPAGPTASPMTLTLTAGDYYTVGLQITVPASATGTHDFNIRGTVGGAYVGEVTLSVNGHPGALQPPAPYVNGGYHSPDVLLYAPNGWPVPLSGEPNGDSLLQPNTAYTMRAVVHNASPTDAVNTVVRFWKFIGGVSQQGVFIDVQTVTVPGNGQVEVTAAHPFLSGPAGQHQCAVVSISNSQSNFNMDATTFAQIPAPQPPGDPSPSAWRNTDSGFIFLGKPWTLELEVAYPLLALPHPGPDPGPVRVDIQSLQIPAKWETIPQVAAARQLLIEGGARNEQPPYLLSALQGTLQAADMGVKVSANGPNLKVETIKQDSPAHLASFMITVPTGKSGPFVITGNTPANARPGDVYLVQITAAYQRTAQAPAREVQFTQALYVHG